MKKNFCLDKLLINTSISLIILPIILFSFFYLKIYISIPFILILFNFWYQLSKNIKYQDITINKKKIIKLLIVLVITLLWVKYSGIGSFSYQNEDFLVRNAVFNDLINYNWPIIFNKSTAFSYYFTYWIPAALIGKLFGITVANYFIYFYSVISILLIIYLIKRFTKKNIFLITLIFIFFSGLDIIGTILERGKYIYPLLHIERWAIYFQYSSLTTCLYWVFNQAIPVWLISSLFLNITDNKKSISLCSLAFAYSPWATIGLIPFALMNILNKNFKQNIKKYLNVNSILLITSMLLIFGSFYLTNKNSTSVKGFIWDSVNKPFWIIIGIYLIFVILEFFLYVLSTIKLNKKNKYYLCTLMTLLLIPMYQMTPANDFCMRVSIPAIFILMCFVIKSMDLKNNKKVTITLIFILLIGAITPFNEIYRSIYLTNNKPYLKYTEVSIAKPSKANKALFEKQFYVHNYKETFFFKYLAK